MYLHLREEVDDQHSCNDESKTDDGRQVGFLMESENADNGDEYYADSSPDAIGNTDG